jgi:hypothetical protein
MESANLILLAIGGWASAMVFALAILTMAGRQDRAARDEQIEIAGWLWKHRREHFD